MNEYLGHDSLIETSEKTNFNDWLYRNIVPAIKSGDILEVGSGIGTYSQKIINDFADSRITLTDFSLNYVTALKEKFQGNNVTITKLDLDSAEDYSKIGYERFDTIIAINVLDNVKDDEYALEQLYKLLKKDGMLIMLLPAYKFLFNSLDSNIGRLRRYSRLELENKIRKTSFHVNQMFFFNAFGILGWYFNGKSGKKPTLSNNAFKIFDSFIPVLKFIDILTGKRIGLSIICYLRK